MAPPASLACLFLAACAQPVAAAGPLEALATRLAAGGLEGVTGALVSRRGETVLEAYPRGYGPERAHDIRSATKSITAILVGELIEDGRLAGVTARLSDLLADEFAHLPAPADARARPPGAGRGRLERRAPDLAGVAGGDDGGAHPRAGPRLALRLPLVAQPRPSGRRGLPARVRPRQRRLTLWSGLEGRLGSGR